MLRFFNKKTRPILLKSNAFVSSDTMNAAYYYLNMSLNINTNISTSSNGKYIMYRTYTGCQRIGTNSYFTGETWYYSNNYGQTFNSFSPNTFPEKPTNISNNGISYYVSSGAASQSNVTISSFNLNNGTVTVVNTFNTGVTLNGEAQTRQSNDGTKIVVAHTANSNTTTVTYSVSTNSGSSFTTYTISGLSSAQWRLYKCLLNDDLSKSFFLFNPSSVPGPNSLAYYNQSGSLSAAGMIASSGLPLSNASVFNDIYSSDPTSDHTLEKIFILGTSNTYVSYNSGVSFSSSTKPANAGTFTLGVNRKDFIIPYNIVNNGNLKYPNQTNTFKNNINPYVYRGAETVQYPWADKTALQYASFNTPKTTDYMYLQKLIISRPNTSSTWSGYMNLYKVYYNGSL